MLRKTKKIFALIMALIVLTTTLLYPESYAFAEENTISAENPLATDTDAAATDTDADLNGEGGIIEDLLVLYASVSGITIASRTTYYCDGYNGSLFHLSNGVDAFCMEYNLAHAPEGHDIESMQSLTADIFKKILYYGWGGPAQWSGFGGDISKGVVCTNIALSYAYNSGSVSLSGTPLAFWNYVQSAPDIPSSAMSFQPSSCTAYVSNGVQRTQDITFNADSRLKVSITLDSDMKLYFTDSAVAYTGTVEITGGKTFYITAPVSKNANWNVNAVYSGNQLVTVTQAFPVFWEKGYQKMAYRGYGSASASLEVDFKETLGALEIYKSSARPEITNGNSCYSCAGAVYGIYGTYSDAQNKTNMVTSITTKVNADKTCSGKADNLPFGTYYIRELQSPSGFAVDNSIYTAKINSSTAVRLNVSDKPQMDPVGVLLTKQSDSGKKIEGAEFTFKFYEGVQSNTDPALTGKTPSRTWVMKSGSNGEVKFDENYKVSGDDFYYYYNQQNVGFPALPLGTLTIQETYAPPEYVLNDEVFVRTITKSGYVEEVYTYNAPVITNKDFYAYLKIVKVDSKTGKNILNNPAAFKIWSYGQNAYVEFDGVSEFSTNNNGELITPDCLSAGKYRIEEVIAPEGYYSDEPGKTYDIDILTTGNYTQYVDENGVAVTDMGLFTVEIDNTASGGFIEIEKSAEQYGAYNTAKGAYELGYISLSAVDFDIYANEDIYSADGQNTLVYAKGDFVETITTDDSGYAISSELLLGDYIIKEQTPEGYIKLDDIEVTLSMTDELRDETVNGTYHKAYYETVVVKNILQKSKISVYKQDETKTYNLAGASFGLYEYNDEFKTKEDYIDSGIMIASAVTDADGKAYFGITPLGKYVIVETEAPDGYRLSKDFHVIDAAYDDTGIEYVETEDIYIDDVARGSVKLLKRDMENHELQLEGVKFFLYRKADADDRVIADIAEMIKAETELDEEMKAEVLSHKASVDDIYVGTYASDENGEINIYELPIGTYYFVETETNYRYLLNKEIHEFEVVDNAVTVLTVYNDGRIGSLILTDTKQPEGGGWHTPKTGDGFNIMMCVIFALLSGTGCTFLIITAHKRRKKVKAGDERDE